MEVLLLKDWAENKKGDVLSITDQSVLDKGFSVGLFANVEDKAVTEEPEEDKAVKNKSKK